MNETPNFEEYSYDALLDAYEAINESKYPESKAIVARLLEERKGTEEAIVAVKKQRYSTFWPRFFASFIDGICLAIIAYSLSMVIGFLPMWPIPAFEFLSFFDLYIYSVALHALSGQTFGKVFMSVKVVNYLNEEDISFKQAFMRDAVPISIALLSVVMLPVDSVGNWPGQYDELLIWVLTISFAWFIIDIITMLSNEKRRTMHDYIAGTVVINI
jgi:uncharacterized RDD family membrane protein YckC